MVGLWVTCRCLKLCHLHNDGVRFVRCPGDRGASNEITLEKKSHENIFMIRWGGVSVEECGEMNKFCLHGYTNVNSDI